MGIEELEVEALKLAPQVRARLAENLIKSLENLSDDENQHFTQAGARLSEEAFRAVWDNSDDAEYDRL